MWKANAPANIALIKYMGKNETCNKKNIPLNTSISYILPKYLSFVEVSLYEGDSDLFVNNSQLSTTLYSNFSNNEISRFLQHAQFLKEHFEFEKNFSIKSWNNFPTGIGIASSASSFAALTKTIVAAIVDLKNEPYPSNEYLSQLSRVASGSSCRSFFQPWSIWTPDKAEKLDIPIKDLITSVIIIDKTQKKISSSQAHKLVRTSLLFENRPQRANFRAIQLIDALKNSNWQAAYKIAWQEFMDMHALFHTSDSPFFYITPKSWQILSEVQKFWEDNNDGPIITMDAGPAIHLLWRSDQSQLLTKFNPT